MFRSLLRFTLQDFLLPYLKSIWTGHHLKPLTEEFRQAILAVKAKNEQQFIPTLLIGHNSLPIPAVSDGVSAEELRALESGSFYVTMKNNNPSRVP